MDIEFSSCQFIKKLGNNYILAVGGVGSSPVNYNLYSASFSNDSLTFLCDTEALDLPEGNNVVRTQQFFFQKENGVWKIASVDIV